MPNWNFYVALTIMLAGTILIVIDTLEIRHTHIIEHSHPHNHFMDEENHAHTHLHIHENEE